MPANPDLIPPSTVTLQNVVDYCRSFPECNPILPVGGYSYEPALTFANDVLQKILAQGINWRWNSAYVPLFLTNALQQDYITNITDMGWLTSAFIFDINNNTNANFQAPKPLYTLTVNRDLGLTAWQGTPSNICFIQNSQANFWVWQPQTVVPCGYGVSNTPVTPIQQMVDSNGNMLFINSASMNITPNVLGYSGTTIPLPVPNPYGTTGLTAPVLPPFAPAGTQVTDGTVTWTVASPNGFCLRVSPIPGNGGLTWLAWVEYQRKAPKYTSLQQTISPIPDESAFLFREGFLAKLYDAAGSPKAAAQYQKWEEQIIQARMAMDRETLEFGMTPASSIMGGSPQAGTIIPAGPSSPYVYLGLYGM
jgi:hypothetical protein